jgi:hypothetical protein
MLRLLLIFILIFYVLYKMGLFRVFVSNAREGYQGSQKHNRPPNSNVNIDSNPSQKKKSDYKGGEYIDYEEVK